MFSVGVKVSGCNILNLLFGVDGLLPAYKVFNTTFKIYFGNI